jgi:hypothetical protein
VRFAQSERWQVERAADVARAAAGRVALRSSRLRTAAGQGPGRGHVSLPVRYLDGSFPELCYRHSGTHDIEGLKLDKQLKRDPAWSPDGTRLAFVRGGPGDGEIVSWNFWRHMDCPEGADECRVFGQQRRVASGSEPAWSPSGTQIAFVSRRSGNADIYVVRDGGGAARRLTKTFAKEARRTTSRSSHEDL